MAILLIDSKDNVFLNLIMELVKKFKGAEAELIDTDDSIVDIDETSFLQDMVNSSKSGLLSKEETDDFMNELNEAAE